MWPHLVLAPNRLIFVMLGEKLGRHTSEAIGRRDVAESVLHRDTLGGHASTSTLDGYGASPRWVAWGSALSSPGRSVSA